MARPSRPTVDEALAIVRHMSRPTGNETVPIASSLNRVTAQSIRALRNVPSFRAAAMDGYALRSADLGTPGGIAITGVIAAGTAPSDLLPGTALAISTGAPVPLGCDRIILREQASVTGDRLHAETLPGGTNIRAVGEDMEIGTTTLEVGRVITPDAIGALIASGHTDVTVRRRPTLALFSTGSELGRGDDVARTPDSNGPMITAAAIELQLDMRFLGQVADQVERLDEALAHAAGSNLVISTGGVSGGNHDLVRAALERRGARILFHGVAMRPGKPMLFAELQDGGLYFGLPGNPVAAMVCFRFFVSAAVRVMLGLSSEQGEPIDGDQPGRDGTTLFLRGRRAVSAKGHVTIDTSSGQQSHILSSVVASDSWLRVDRTPDAIVRRAFQKAARLD